MKSAYPAIPFGDRLARVIGIPLIGFINPLIFFDYTLNDGLVAYPSGWLLRCTVGSIGKEIGLFFYRADDASHS